MYKKDLKRLQHKPKIFPQYSPHENLPIQYEIKVKRQYKTSPDESSYLSPTEKHHLISSRNILYYGRAIESSILPTLNEIESKQA